MSPGAPRKPSELMNKGRGAVIAFRKVFQRTSRMDEGLARRSEDVPVPWSFRVLLDGLVVLAVTLVVGYWVRLPYRGAPFILDELLWQTEIGLLEMGRWSWWSYLTPDDEHNTPLLRWLFYCGWRVFGDNPDAFRFIATMLQSFAAGLMYLVLRRYGGGRAGSVLGSMLFGIMANASWDSAFLWSIAGLAFAGISSMLLALMLWTSWIEERPGLAMVGMTITAVVLVAYWGVALGLLIVVPAQVLLLHPGAWGRPGGKRFLAAWLLVVLGMGIIAVLERVVVFPHLYLASRGLPHTVTWDEPVRLALLYAVGLGSLLFGYTWDLEHPPREVAMPYVVAMAMLLAATWWIPRRQKKLLLLFVLISLPMAALTIVVRPGSLGPEKDLSEARYYFMPEFTWCALIGLVAGALEQRGSAGPRRLAWAALWVGIPLFAFVQHREAAKSRAVVDPFLTPTQELFGEYRAILDHAARVARERGKDVALPDIPVPIPPPQGTHLCQPLSARVVFASKGPPEGVRLVPLDRIQADEIADAKKILAGMSIATANKMQKIIDLVVPDALALRWIVSRQAARELPVPLAAWWISYPELDMTFPAWQLRFCCEEFPAIRVIPEGPTFLDHVHEELKDKNDAESRNAIRFLARLFQRSFAPE